ncbi:CDP-alcohol phosphatidyltransferase family protein [Aeromonas cavernicola]|uniref:CDP-alcohol phosphatidyltransferase n=1 Tax=Aeromonas cavernicola TaxID=1006623 RepID=A0A2H9U7A8_9GAMM|nr:CDP-alcohol phosphatidyltransferase family protein [Aeromonas cavernicola]PJG59936.1 CDP-alcohol phosphatidyltransferase [Aeromonas cavernicola]
MSISIYLLKPYFQQLLRPSLRGLARTGITPNQITLTTLLLAILYGAALTLIPSSALWFGLPFILLLRMALNALDGMLATHTEQQTPLGALLNELCDVLADLALYLPFALLTEITTPLLLTVVLCGLLAEFSGVLACTIGATRRFDGPMGKSDRAFAFGLLAVMVWSSVEPLWLNGVLIIMLLLTARTIFNRLHQALACAPSTP